MEYVCYADQNLAVYLDEQKVGGSEINGNGEIALDNIGAGEKTLKLVFHKPEEFRLIAVTLK